MSTKDTTDDTTICKLPKPKKENRTMSWKYLIRDERYLLEREAGLHKERLHAFRLSLQSVMSKKQLPNFLSWH